MQPNHRRGRQAGARKESRVVLLAWKPRSRAGARAGGGAGGRGAGTWGRDGPPWDVEAGRPRVRVLVTPRPPSAAQRHPGARGDVQRGVHAAPGPLCQRSRHLQPHQVGGREGLGGCGGGGRLAGLTSLLVPSASCLLSRFPKPPRPIILRDCQVLPLPPGLPLTHSQDLTPGAPPAGPQPRPPTAADPEAEPTLLRHPQVRARPGGSPRALHPGRGPSPEPADRSAPRRALWSSPRTCRPWAATPSCCTATSRTTPPSPWRSSSAAAESGRVSGRGARCGRAPAEGRPGCPQPHGVVVTRRGRIRPRGQFPSGVPGAQCGWQPQPPAPSQLPLDSLM